MPERIADQLDVQFDRLISKTQASAASITIWKPGLGYWERSRGVSETGSNSFWWASTGKLATATIILQLVSEGKLARDTPVKAFFPEFVQASVADIDDLLHHTSGIFSFNYDVKLRKRKGYKSPQYLIDVAKSHPLDFCPGTNWHYTNTGYVMLARIAEKIEGLPFSEILEQRISKPLGLSSFRMLEPDDDASAVVPLDGENADKIPEIASVFGAGGVVAPSSQMLAFLHAYLERGLVSPSVRNKAVSKLYPMFGGPTYYGDGIMVMDVPDKERPTTWIGHSGGSENAKALLIYDIKRDTYVAIALNDQAPAEAITNMLLKILDG